jgi:serpin B
MMRQVESFRDARLAGAQAVELPDDGREVSMVVILPDEGSFESFEAGLDAAALGDLLAGLKRARVDLSLPKFEFDAQFALKEALQALGMPSAFGDESDFSGIDGTRDLKIADVVQAFVAVDEAGTEAAAATAVVMETRAMAPSEPVVMTVDRPFLILIKDDATGTVLFIGRVLEP